MREVCFADDTKFMIGMCGMSNGVLWILLSTDMTFLEIVTFLSHPTNTETIKCYSVGHEEDAQVYEGYTGLTMVQKTAEGYQVALRKEEDA